MDTVNQPLTLLTWDAETFYAKDYSLSKISTGAYVDDPRFELIGSAIKRNEEPTESFTGTYEETRHWLHSFDWKNSALIAHNAVFDATILAWRFGIYPKMICDTLSMARAVHGTEVGGSLKALTDYYGIGSKGTEVITAIGKRREDFTEEEMERYMSYCRNDVDITYELFKKLAPRFTGKEMKLIDMTIRMHSEPKLSLDQRILEESLEEIRIKKEKALEECGVSKEDLMSNQKFAEVLKLLGVEPPMKVSPTTGKPTFAFAKKDEDLLALLDHDDIRVQTVVSARLQTKETLEETKTLRLIEVAERGDALPVGLKYYGAEVSGRWSAGGDNGALQLQNVARESKIKEAIVAPLGYSIIGLDLSNIEVRVNLYLAGQGDQLDIIRSGLDMYRDFGNKVFNVPYDEITKAQRFISKTAVLGLGFGAGAKVLCKAINLGAKQYGFEVDVDEDEAKRIVGVYREINHLVKKAWYQGEEVLEAMRDNAEYVYDPGYLPLSVRGSQGIHLPSGLYIKYPKLRQFANEEGKNEWLYEGRRNVEKRIYGPKVLQNATQSVARCVIAEAMVRIGKKYPPSLTVHDSLYVVVPSEQAEEAYDFMMAEMTRPPKWAPDLPLAAEGGIGTNLKEAG